MDNLIEVDREIIKMQLIHDLPESDKKKIFIPAYSINYTHYYFLLDFKRCIIVCWSVNVEKLVNYFTSFIKDRNDIKVPWNKDFKSYMESIFFPHSVQSYRDKVIISFIGGNAFLELDIYNFSHKLIIDELNFGSSMMYSSTNEILAYNLSNSLAIDIVTETINKLVKLKSFKLHKDAFIHSDQGSHYTSPIFQKLLKKYNLGQSMSRRGNCWDNAPQESFFGHMKDEIDYKSCETIEELKILIDDYMDYYNNERCQWNLKKLTPVQYRNQLLVTS